MTCLLIKHRRTAVKFLHGSVLRQFVILLVILFLLTIFLLLDVINGIINLAWLVGGLLVGVLVGLLAARMFKIKWKDEKITSKMDKIGLVVLAAYLVFSFSKTWLFGHWLNGASLTSFSFSIAAGIMAGRLVSMSRQVESLLKERKII